MKLNDKNRLRIAFAVGIANLLTIIAILCFVVSVIMIFISGFDDWQKSLFIYSLIVATVSYLLSRLGSVVIKKSENR